MPKRVALHLSDDTAEQLARLAETFGQPTEQIIARAIDDYIREQTIMDATIAESLATYRAGVATLIPHDEVITRTEQRLR